MSKGSAHIPDLAQRQAWEALWRRLLLPNKRLSPSLRGNEQRAEAVSRQDQSAGVTDVNPASKEVNK